MPIKQITIKVVKRGNATDYRIRVTPDTAGEQPKMYLLAVAQQMVVEQSYTPGKAEEKP